jgi:hypothetical protein
MFSFLPHDYKKKIIRIYRSRLLALYLIGLIFVGTFSVAMLVPSYKLSLSRNVEVNAELASLRKSIDLKKNNDTSEFVDGASVKIKAAVSNKHNGYVTNIIKEVLSRKSSSISLSDMSFERTATGLNMNLSGVALTRETFLSFVKDLRASDYFKSINYPVSTLAKDKNISFALTLEAIL